CRSKVSCLINVVTLSHPLQENSHSELLLIIGALLQDVSDSNGLNIPRNPQRPAHGAEELSPLQAASALSLCKSNGFFDAIEPPPLALSPHPLKQLRTTGIVLHVGGRMFGLQEFAHYPSITIAHVTLRRGWPVEGLC